jgi:beta-mannosidase
MACGSYPEEKDWFIEELRKESRYIARLCRNQPCLMWWSGDNENAVNGCDTDENYRGRRSAYDGIAPILYRDDPYRRFLPSSPYGGKNYASNTVGTTHNTQCFGYFCGCIMNTDLSDYKEALKKYRARFIAEEPQLGAASLPSLRRFMTEEDIFGDDQKMWLYHMKGNPAMNIELFELPLTMARRLLGNFESPDDKLFKLQYVQYEWVRVVMEQARRERDFCSGIIFWMMNDCWPSSAGWALVDYYNLPKNAFYAFKRCAKPIIASIDYEDGKYSAYVINDGNEKIAHVSIKVLSKDRTTLTECASLNIRVRSESSDVVFEKAEHLNDGEVLICEIDGEFGHDRTFYSHGGLKICPSPIDFEIDKENKTLTVTAKAKYIHAVTILGNAIFKDNCFSLFPHESRTVSYRPIGSDIDEDLTVEAYTLQ